MGAFKDYVTNKESDWWHGGDVDYVMTEFYTFLTEKIADQRETLRSAKKESKERYIYEYLFGKEETQKLLKSKLGEIDLLEHNTKAMIEKIKGHNLAANLEEIQIKSKMTELLDLLDHFAGQIESIGSLRIKRTMMEKVFGGVWEPTADSRIPPKAKEPCNAYNLKHFGVDKKAACYLGEMKDLRLVKAMEEKAKKDGLQVPGGVIFRFDVQIGWDSESGDRSTPNTCAIRVDSIGTNQHSHPLAETGTKHPSFQMYVVKEIIGAARTKDQDELIEIARFLTVIGATSKEFAPPGKLKQAWREAQEKGMKLPDCKFW